MDYHWQLPCKSPHKATSQLTDSAGRWGQDSAYETSYGESIDHLFRLAMKDQLTDTVDKSFHSFRHHISTFLTNEADVKDSWRDVILGHKGKSTGEVFYNDGIYMNNLRSVTERIPRIQALDECIKGLSKGENGRSKIRVLPATTSRRKPRSRKIKLSD